MRSTSSSWLAAADSSADSFVTKLSGVGHWPTARRACGVTFSTYQNVGSPPVSVFRKSRKSGSSASRARATDAESSPVLAATSLTVTM